MQIKQVNLKSFQPKNGSHGIKYDVLLTTTHFYTPDRTQMQVLIGLVAVIFDS